MKKKFSILLLGSILLQQLIAPTNLIYATQTSEKLTTYDQLEERDKSENLNTDIIYYDLMENDPNIQKEDLASINLSNSRGIVVPPPPPPWDAPIESVYYTEYYDNKGGNYPYPPMIYNLLYPCCNNTFKTSDGMVELSMNAQEHDKALLYIIIQNGKLIASSTDGYIDVDTSKLTPNENNLNIYAQLISVDDYGRVKVYERQLLYLTIEQGSSSRKSNPIEASDSLLISEIVPPSFSVVPEDVASITWSNARGPVPPPRIPVDAPIEGVYYTYTLNNNYNTPVSENLLAVSRTFKTSYGTEKFDMDAREPNDAILFIMMQDGDIIDISTGGTVYVDISEFTPNEKVYVQLVAFNDSDIVQAYDRQLTKIKIEEGSIPEPEPEPEPIEVSGSLPISEIFPPSFSVVVPSNIAFIGNTRLDFGFDKGLSKPTQFTIPTSGEVDYRFGPYTTDFNFGIFDIETNISGVGSGKYDFDSNSNDLTLSADFFAPIDSDEIWYLPKIKILGINVDPRVNMKVSGDIQTDTKIHFDDIPKWSPQIDSDYQFAIEGNGTLDSKIGLPFSLSTNIGGGLGLIYEHYNSPKVFADINAYIQFKILWWKFKINLYDRYTQIYPAGRSLDLPFNDDEELVFSMTQLQRPKSNRHFIPMIIDSQNLLDNYVYDQSKPRLLLHNGVEYAFWIDYNESYDSFPNGARLVYAYRSVGDSTWSEPIIVDDDGTNDFDYDVAISDDDKIHVIWQNATQLFDEEQTFMLDEIGNLTEINYKIIEARQTTPINLLKSEHSSDDEQDPYEPGDMLPDFEGSKPIPDRPIPDMPIPDGPTPSVPTPSVPTPSIPTPSVPTPSVPTPSVPTPSIPTPSIPTPSIPTPSIPTPDMPTPDMPEIMPLNSEEAPVIPNTAHKPGNMLPGFKERPVGPSIGNMLPDFDKSQAIPDIPVFDDSKIFEIGYETTTQGAIKLSGGRFGAIPKVAVDGNKATVTWVENTENAVLLDKGTNYVVSIGIEDLILERTPSIIHVTDMIPYGMDTEYVDGEHVILYSADTDNDITTDTDREIFYVKNGEGSQITHNDYFEDVPKLVKNNGNVSAFWASMDNIYHAEDIRSIQSYHGLFETPISIDGSGFEVISDGNDMSILWKTKVMDEDAVNKEQDIMAMSVDEIEEQTLTKIMARHVENYEWTDSYTILENSKDISLISGYRVDSEDMAVVYSITDTTEDGSFSQLIYDTLTRKMDLKLDSVKTYEAAIPGELLKLDVTVSNDGAFDIEDGIEIEIRDQNGDTIYSEELYVGNGLKIGESKTVEIIDFTIPEELDDVENYTIQVSVNDDSDELNNIKEITVGDVDLGLEIEHYIINNQTVAQVRVFNNSAVRADSKIEIRTDNREGELISEIDVQGINIDDDHYYTINLHTLLEENNQEVPEKVHFNIVAEDTVLNNNTNFVVMNIIEPDSSYEEDSEEDDSYYYEGDSSEDDYNYYEEEYYNSDNDTLGEEEVKHSEPEDKAKNNFVDLSKLIGNKEIDANLNTEGKTTTLTFNIKDKEIIGRKAKIDIEGNQLGNLAKTVLNEADKNSTSARLVLNVAAMPTNANTVEIEMASNQLAELLDGDLGTVVEIQTEHGSIILDYRILNELIKESKNQKILFKITNGVDGLSFAQRAVLGSNPAYTFSVSANGQILNDFENDFGVKIKYYSMAGYNANTMQITFMDKSIKSPRIVEYTPKVDELFFETNGLSTFFIESK